MAILNLPLAGPTEYVHGVDMFRKGIDSQGPYYTVEYYIADWANGDEFANTLMGLSSFAGGRAIPHRHPLSTNLVCVEAHVEGVGGVALSASPAATSGLPGYTGGAKVRATYRAPMVGGMGFPSAVWDPGYKHQIDPTTPILWATIELNSQTEVLTYPGEQYTWFSDGAPCDTDVQFDIDILVMNITFHRLSFLPTTALRTFKRCLNNAPFLGAAAETVRFASYRTRLQANTDGTALRDCTIQLLERDVASWNKLLRPGGVPDNPAAWDYPEDAAGNRRFVTKDLNLLLQAFA